MLRDHCRATVGCELANKPARQEDGIDDRQMEEIELILSKKVHKNICDISRWNMIWEVLFPGVEKPSNPCRCSKPILPSEPNLL
jgi:hypothetical protein